MKTSTLLSPAVRVQLAEIAKTTKMSPTQVMEIALIQLFGEEDNFITCPGCGDHLAIKGTMSGEPPIEVFVCGCCNTSVVYDTDKETIVTS